MPKPDAQRYVDVARHHYDVFVLLASASRAADAVHSTDWQVVLLYYVLCIEVKALGSCRGKELQDHYAIKQWLNSEADLLSIAKTYRKAEEWSRDARYEGRDFTTDELRRYHQWFAEVERRVRGLLTNEDVRLPVAFEPADYLFNRA